MEEQIPSAKKKVVLFRDEDPTGREIVQVSLRKAQEKWRLLWRTGLSVQISVRLSGLAEKEVIDELIGLSKFTKDDLEDPLRPKCEIGAYGTVEFIQEPKIRSLFERIEAALSIFLDEVKAQIQHAKDAAGKIDCMIQEEQTYDA